MKMGEGDIHHSRKNEGTSAIFVFTTIVPIVFTIFQTVFIDLRKRKLKVANKFLLEFVIIVFSVILCVTVLIDYITTVLLVLMLLSFTLGYTELKKSITSAEMVQMSSEHPGYITILRATINLVTCVCILAIDFNIFPGYLSKTKHYGFSLMDSGIGLFVLSGGIVSKKLEMGHFKSFKNIFLLLWQCFPFIILGIGRAVVIKQIDYHQGVTEYGVHWNAFLTLGITRLFGTILASFLTHPKYLSYLAIWVVATHEFILQAGVADFVMDTHTERDTFFRANREGIVSLPGYVSLHLASMYLGYLLQFRKPYVTCRDLLLRLVSLIAMASVLWIAVFQIEAIFGISRRICNMGYVFWTLCIATSMIVLFISIEIFASIVAIYRTKDKDWTYIPLIMRAINYNGLLFFLQANVLTGVVNMVFETHSFSVLPSLLIILVYSFINCFVITVLYVKKVKVKFW